MSEFNNYGHECFERNHHMYLLQERSLPLGILEYFLIIYDVGSKGTEWRPVLWRKQSLVYKSGWEGGEFTNDDFITHDIITEISAKTFGNIQDATFYGTYLSMEVIKHMVKKDESRRTMDEVSDDLEFLFDKAVDEYENSI